MIDLDTISKIEGDRLTPLFDSIYGLVYSGVLCYKTVAGEHATLEVLDEGNTLSFSINKYKMTYSQEDDKDDECVDTMTLFYKVVYGLVPAEEWYDRCLQ